MTALILPRSSDATAQDPATVEHRPIGRHDFTVAQNAAIRFASHFAPDGDLIDAVIGEVRTLRQPFRSPEALKGEHVKSHSTNNAHWADSVCAVDETELLHDVRAAAQAAAITGTLWTAIRAADGLQPGTDHRTFPGAFAPEWLAALRAPTIGSRSAEQAVALARADDFDRYPTPEQVDASYEVCPRTYVFESVHGCYAWALLASRWLGALAGGLSVLATIYDSRSGDEHLDAHWDAWCGAVVQLSGAKKWIIGGGLLSGDPQNISSLTMYPGDVMILPDGVPHLVETPADPGHSRHLVLTVRRRELDEDR
jgi:hypothetical protein